MTMVLSTQDEHILAARIRPLVTAELIERARRSPEPPYPPDIAEVLDFVRRNPDPERPRYLIVRLEEEFAVAIRSPAPGAAPRLADGTRFATRAEAEHAVLLARLADYGVTW